MPEKLPMPQVKAQLVYVAGEEDHANCIFEPSIPIRNSYSAVVLVFVSALAQRSDSVGPETRSNLTPGLNVRRSV